MTFLSHETQFHPAPRRIVVRVDGIIIPTTSDVTITESMDQLTTVAEFSIATRGGSLPVQGQSVTIAWVDLKNAKSRYLFGGTIDTVEVDSEPWAYRCRCVDQLAKFRATKQAGDLELTGMTDGEAWKAIADYCGISYNPSDIDDQGYVLGGLAPLYWKADGQTPASQIIRELDNIFRCNTQTVQNNRVIRVAYDPFPVDDTLAYRTYQKGTSLRMIAHHRSAGGADLIQNVWQVTGAEVELSSACTVTPWAKAREGNAALGSRRVRTITQSITSDFIQDTSLALAIVKWKMGETNRSPENATIDLFNDPNIHPCTIIGVKDMTPGIESPPRYYLVTDVNRSGLTMSLDIVGGGPGSEGLVTYGMDQQCNDTGSDGAPQDDGFDWGPVDVPPIDLGDTIDPGDFPDGGDSDTSENPPPPPPDEPLICSDPVDTSWIKGTGSGVNYIDGPWRGTASLEAGWEYVTVDGHPAELGTPLYARMTGGSASLIYSTQPDRFLRTSADDKIYPALSMIAVCVEAALCGVDAHLTIALLRQDTGAVFSAVDWYGQPDGISTSSIPTGPRTFTGTINLQNGDVTTDLDQTPSDLSNGPLHRNTGHYFPFPGPGDGAIVNSDTGINNPEDYTYYTFCAAFDLTTMYQSAWAFGDMDEGRNTSERCLTEDCMFGEIVYSPNPYDFKLSIGGSKSPFTGGMCPPLQIKKITIGDVDCELNADYETPWTRNADAEG